MNMVKKDLKVFYWLLTAPGVMLHEYAHKEVVDDFGLTIHSINYFQLDDPPGQVTHDTPQKFPPMLAISAAPFILNTFVSFSFIFWAIVYYSAIGLENFTTLRMVFLGSMIWLGFSVGIHAFPSKQDVKNIWAAAKRNKMNPFTWISMPVILLLYVLTKTRRVGSHYLYTGMIGYLAYDTVLTIFEEMDSIPEFEELTFEFFPEILFLIPL